MPFYEPGEMPVFRQNGLEFTVDCGGSFGEYKGKGHAILTTRRLILINTEIIGKDFRSFSLPYDNTFEEFMR